MTKKIIVKVNPDGSIELVTKGYKGQSCKDASAELQRALGMVTEDKPTSEMFQVEASRLRISGSN